jgi:O-antigen biosynthesis protein
LNSDVEVPSGWLERLMAPLLKDEKVACATPFTNAGTICSFPRINLDNPLPAGSTVDQVDSAFRHVTADYPYIELPTGVGFCMAVSRVAWLKIGGLDTAFGRGYAEENDWCQRAKRAGFVNILVPNLFVYHKHGGSFASSERQALQAHNLAMLHRRYPSYDRDVRAFIKRDPMSGLRDFLKILVARYVSPSGVLIADHQLGGGANAYRQRLSAKRLHTGAPVLMCAPNLRNRTAYDLDLCSPFGDAHFTFGDLNQLREVARYLAIGEIFMNNLVDWPRPLEALECLTKISQEINASVTLPVHDFFPICPSYNLLNRDGWYCGVPSIADCRQCLPHNRFAHNPEAVAIDRWRERWQEFFAAAQNVLFFSNDSLSLLRRVYDLQTDHCHVRPHEVNTHELTSPQVSFGDGLHIGVVGAINHAKGAAIVSEIAGILDKENDGTTLSVIGPYDGWLRGKYVRVTGPYSREQLPDLLSDLRINVCFLPSIWPETYSYVTSELISLGMPLCVFDLGAPAERVRSYEKGCVIQSIDAADALRAIRRLYESLRRQADGVVGPGGAASMRPLDPGFDRSTKIGGDE